jgi:hypothetical protein
VRGHPGIGKRECLFVLGNRAVNVTVAPQALSFISVGTRTRNEICCGFRKYEFTGQEAYAKLSLKKYRPMAARNEDKKVFSGLL